MDRQRLQIRHRAGWHLSYYMGVAELARKVESFSHREYDTHAVKAADHIRQVRCWVNSPSSGPNESQCHCCMSSEFCMFHAVRTHFLKGRQGASMKGLCAAADVLSSCMHACMHVNEANFDS